MVGIEPTTFSLRVRCSAIEPHQHIKVWKRRPVAYASAALPAELQQQHIRFCGPARQRPPAARFPGNGSQPWSRVVSYHKKFAPSTVFSNFSFLSPIARRLRFVLAQEILRFFFEHFVGFWHFLGGGERGSGNKTQFCRRKRSCFSALSARLFTASPKSPSFLSALHKSCHKIFLRIVIHTFHRVFHKGFS